MLYNKVVDNHIFNQFVRKETRRRYALWMSTCSTVRLLVLEVHEMNVVNL
jgi:hypothetical protein